MDETTQKIFSPETEVPATETATVETDPLPSDEVPATIAATVPPPVSTFDPYEIIYGVDSFPESTTAPTSETVPMTTEPTYIEVIETVGADIVHSTLFGAFLICGTLVGLTIFRRLYGP